jgi:HSP20 family protein
MTLLRINPMVEFERMAKKLDEMSSIFEKANNDENIYSVRSDISEDEKMLYITLELPGVSKEDINISMDKDRNLTIKGEKKRSEEFANRNIIRNESIYGKFSRSFILSNDLDDSNINARFENGILNISIPKKQKEEKEIKISIN